MLLVDSKTGKPWDQEIATSKLRQIREQVIAELRQRDERKSGGRISAANGWKVYQFRDAEGVLMDKPDGTRSGTYTIHPELAAMKHTGRDVRRETMRRWLEFCKTAQPQDEVAESVAVMKRDRQIAKAQKFVDAGPDLGLTPPKRGPGRPRKSETVGA